MVQLFNRDCMEAKAEMPDNLYDLAIVDPPYGIGEDGLKNHSRGCKKYPPTKFKIKDWDKEPADRAYFTELKRVSRHQIIWGANHFIENIPNANSSSWIVWDKKNGDKDFADAELAYTSFKKAVRMVQYKWDGFMQHDMKNKETRIHPCQKPIGLYKWLLRRYAKKGWVILDTHLGSGSSAIAAHELGFNFVGYELDKDYYKDALKRLHRHQRQLRLFVD